MKRGHSLNGERSGVSPLSECPMGRVCSPANMFPLTTRTSDGSKPAFFLFDQQVTKPFYLVIQLSVLSFQSTETNSTLNLSEKKVGMIKLNG